MRQLSGGIPLPVGDNDITLVVESQRGALLEMEDITFHFDSAVLLPVACSDAGATAEQSLITGLDVLVACYLHVRDHAGDTLLIAGHTDRVGAEDYNRELSRLRAENALYVLLGRRDDWATISHKKHVVKDYQQILAWADINFGFDCDPGAIDGEHGDATTAALRNFQEHYNDQFDGAFPTNGVMTESTWRAFHHLYMIALADLLGASPEQLQTLQSSIIFADSSHRAVGCGFYHPFDENRLAVPDGAAAAGSTRPARSAKDRRVEFLFFSAPDPPSLTCQNAPNACKSGACEIYSHHDYTFDYVEVHKLDTLDFHGHPASLSTTGRHNVVIQPGTAVTLHFSVVNADRVEILATTFAGVTTTAATQSVQKTTTPTNGELTVNPSQDATYVLVACDGQFGRHHTQHVDVQILPADAVPTGTDTTEDTVGSIVGASPVELLARGVFVPETDSGLLAGPVTAPPTPPQVPPRTQATVPTASHPELLNFVAAPACAGDFSAATIRSVAVQLVRDMHGFGISDLPKGRRDSYADLVALGQSKTVRNSVVQPTAGASSCAMVIRTLWWLLGARDFIVSTKETGPIRDGELLNAPPSRYMDGNIIGRILRFAKLCKALHYVHTDAERNAFDPKPGDVIFLTQTVRKPPGSKPESVARQHIFTVVRREGDVIYSVDGGQSGERKKMKDRTGKEVPVVLPKVKVNEKTKMMDGPCNSIWSVKRTLLPAKLMVIEDWKNPQKNVRQMRFSFEKDDRPIDQWIDVTKLVFTASLIFPVRNPGKVRPGLPDQGIVPSILDSPYEGP